MLRHEDEFSLPAREPARHPDRRRRPRRRLLPRDRAGQGSRDEGVVQRRRVRVAAARLPLRRALLEGPDLSCRRPRRPRDPARAAADLRQRGAEGDPRHPAHGARGRQRQARSPGLSPGASAKRLATERRARTRVLTVQGLLADLELEPAFDLGDRAAADPLGPHLRARGPDAVPLRRRVAADDRDQPDQRRPGSAASPSCSPTRRRRHRPRHRLRPRRAARGARRGGRAPRPGAVRDPLRDAVHRDHRARLHEAGQRAVRRARARHRGARQARAPRPRRARPAPR